MLDHGVLPGVDISDLEITESDAILVIAAIEDWSDGQREASRMMNERKDMLVERRFANGQYVEVEDAQATLRSMAADGEFDSTRDHVAWRFNPLKAGATKLVIIKHGEDQELDSLDSHRHSYIDNTMAFLLDLRRYFTIQ